MMSFLYILIFLFSIYLYASRKYVAFLVSYFALISKIFMLNLGASSIKESDLCLLLSFILIPFVLNRNKRAYSPQGDSFAKLVYIFVAFYFVEFLITIITDAEFIGNGLKVIRGILLLMTYFIFKSIPLEKYRKFLIIGLWITLAQGVLYYLQFLGINLLAGSFKTGTFNFSYGLNIPTLSYFYLFFVLKSSYTSKYKYLLLLFFLGILLLTFVRSILIAAMIGISIFLLINKNRKQSIMLFIASLLFLPIVFNTIEKKAEASSSSVSTVDDIMQIISGVDNLRNIDSNSGTFSFRIGMFVERLDYLIKHPQYLFTGVGTIHEDSPNCYRRFNFYLGTHNEERFYEQCIIESGDIAWVPIVLRYGLLGLLLHVYLFYYVMKVGYKKQDFLQILLPLFVMLFILTFSGPYFERPPKLYEVCLYMAILWRAKKEKQILYI